MINLTGIIVGAANLLVHLIGFICLLKRFVDALQLAQL
jgi:uncharacterized membrane protein YecN with MAPEG domain